MITNPVRNMFKGKTENQDTQKVYRPILNSRTVMLISGNPERIKTISMELYFHGYNSIKEDSCPMAIESLGLLNVAVVMIDLDFPAEETESLIGWLEVNRPYVRTFLFGSFPHGFELYPAAGQPDRPLSYTPIGLPRALKMIRQSHEEDTERES